MKTYIYRGGFPIVEKSGVGKAIEHQEKMLNAVEAPRAARWKEATVVHMNTVFPDSVIATFIAKMQKKKVIFNVFPYISYRKILTYIPNNSRKGNIIIMMSTDIGIDLGTASILVYIKGKGVVLKEPSVVAFDRDTNKIKAIGEEARLMLGRTPGNIVAVRPLRQGVISDYTVTEKMIKYFIQKALGKKTFRKPRISVCVPSGVTEVEKKAVEDATYQAGAREVSIIEEPIAAAIGAGIDIARPCGNMIVDIGGGTADIAVISLGGSVVSTSVKIAGDDFDEAIVRYMRKKHNLLIGERTAEEIKINIGAAYRRPELVTMEVRGRNLVTGLPKTIVVTSDETLEALREPAMQIVDAVHNVLERTPPELAADIFDRGIVLTGGGSLISGLDALIEEKTGITTMIAEEPLTAVAIGTGKFIEFAHGGKGAEK